jgi:hypothetical protein
MQTGTLPVTVLIESRDVGDLYPEGGSYGFKTETIFGNSNIDRVFTAVFVGGEDRIYGPVPEPATWLLLVLGIVTNKLLRRTPTI